MNRSTDHRLSTHQRYGLAHGEVRLPNHKIADNGDRALFAAVFGSLAAVWSLPCKPLAGVERRWSLRSSGREDKEIAVGGATPVLRRWRVGIWDAGCRYHSRVCLPCHSNNPEGLNAKLVNVPRVITGRAAGAGVWGFDGFADAAQAGQHHHRQGAVRSAV